MNAQSGHGQFMPDERYLTRQQVQVRIPKSTATIYRWIKQGHFPKSIQIGPNSVVWRASDIERFIAERTSASP